MPQSLSRMVEEKHNHTRKPYYCINQCLVWSCSVSINSCKSESVKLSPEATLKVTNGQTAVLIGQTPVPNIN